MTPSHSNYKDLKNKVRQLWENVPAPLKNKYIATAILFFIWLLFFDPNNLIERFGGFRKINRLDREKEYYMEKIAEDSTQLQQIKTDKENIEKYAREKYLMKKENEDIFIITEKKSK